MIRAGIIRNNVITNIIVVDPEADLEALGAVHIPQDAAVGDLYNTQQITVWDEMAAAYKEGAQEA